MNAPWRNLLPTSLEVCGTDYAIRSDYRAVLDICAALSDPELNNQDKALVSLDILYTSFEDMPTEHYTEALKKCFWFINGGEEKEQQKKSPKLVDWEQDFRYIIAPINRVTGKEIRDIEYLHWWSFLAAYMEIGDCVFAQIIRIRNLKSKGKKLDKADREWYRQNRDLVDFKTVYTDAEEALLKAWT